MNGAADGRGYYYDDLGIHNESHLKFCQQALDNIDEYKYVSNTFYYDVPRLFESTFGYLSTDRVGIYEEDRLYQVLDAGFLSAAHWERYTPYGSQEMAWRIGYIAARYLNYEIKLRTFFPDDFAPDVYLYAYSYKITSEKLNKIFGLKSSNDFAPPDEPDAIISDSEYWSGGLNLHEGFNYKKICRGGLNKEFNITGSLQQPSYPAKHGGPPSIEEYEDYAPSHKTINGSSNLIAMVCDWWTDSGFKYL